MKFQLIEKSEHRRHGLIQCVFHTEVRGIRRSITRHLNVGQLLRIVAGEPSEAAKEMEAEVVRYV